MLGRVVNQMYGKANRGKKKNKILVTTLPLNFSSFLKMILDLVYTKQNCILLKMSIFMPQLISAVQLPKFKGFFFFNLKHVTMFKTF